MLSLGVPPIVADQAKTTKAARATKRTETTMFAAFNA